AAVGRGTSGGRHGAGRLAGDPGGAAAGRGATPPRSHGDRGDQGGGAGGPDRRGDTAPALPAPVRQRVGLRDARERHAPGGGARRGGGPRLRAGPARGTGPPPEVELVARSASAVLADTVELRREHDDGRWGHPGSAGLPDHRAAVPDGGSGPVPRQVGADRGGGADPRGARRPGRGGAVLGPPGGGARLLRGAAGARGPTGRGPRRGGRTGGGRGTGAP